MNPMPSTIIAEETIKETPEETLAEAPQTLEAQALTPEGVTHSKRQEIKNLLRFTSRRHLIHQLLDAKTGRLISSAFVPAQLYRILRDAPDYQWRERTAAALALREIAMSPAQTLSASRVLGDVMNDMEAAPDLKRQRESQETLHNLGLTGAMVLGVIALGIGIPTKFIPEWLHEIIFNFGCFAGVTSLLWIPAFIILSRHRRKQLRLACAVTLRKLRQPESVRAFAVATRSRKEYDVIAHNALLEILPLLTPEHYGRLEATSVPELTQLLRTASLPPGTLIYSEPLCETVLDALAKIGDGRAVRPVQRLADKCRDRKIREKAIEILPILLERRGREQAHSMLLRGASAPAASEKELLRAANSAPETAPELLLRASQALYNEEIV